MRRHAEVRPGPYVLLAVTDTGRGHGRGRRRPASSSRSSPPRRPGKGTGLGLATVYGDRQADAAGTSRSTARPGRGTTFKVYLPRGRRRAGRPAEPASAAARPARGERDGPAGRGRGRRCATLARGVLEQARVRGAGGRRRRARRCALARAHARPDPPAGDRRGDAGDGRPASSASGCGAAAGAEGAVHVGLHRRRGVHDGVLDAGVAFLQKPFKAMELERVVRLLLE